MREISYEILDLMEEYGADEEGIRRILESGMTGRRSFSPCLLSGRT